MSEVQRPNTQNEPGHRYAPRQVSPRFMELRGTARPVAVSKPDLKTELPPVYKQPTLPVVPKPDLSPPVVTPVVSPEPQKQSKHRGGSKPALPRLNRSLVLKRQIVDKAAQYKKQSDDQRRRMLTAFGLGGVMASLLVGGIFVFYAANQSNQQVLSDVTYNPNPGGVAGVNSSATASESPVTQTDVDSYSVDADKPRLLRIPTLGLQARVYPVQADLNGDPLTTSNIYDVGWLSSGAKPGETGAALFNGYVAGSTKNGSLVNITSMSVGDIVQVEKGDGKVMNFKVVKSQQFAADKVDMKAATSSAIPGKPGLNIVTNTGRFDVRNNKFEPRTVVFTVLD